MRNDWVIEEVGHEKSRIVGDARFVIKDEAVPMQPKLEGKMGMALAVFAQAARDTLEGTVS